MPGFLLGIVLSLMASIAMAAPTLRTVSGHDGVQLLVAEAGDRSAPGILFLHGFGQSYLSFHRQFASELSRRFHLVAFDLRGHGGSGKPEGRKAYDDSQIWADDVAAVMDATGLKRPVIVGWSYGGFVIMDYLRHYGQSRVAGIDLVGSLGGLDGGPPIAPTAGTIKIEGAKGAVETAMQADTRMSRSLDLAENILAAQHRATGYATGNMTDVERTTLFATELMLPAYVRRAMVGRSLNNQDLLPLVTVPVLITRGSDDITTTESSCMRVRDRLRDATLSLYADTGHLTFIEREDRFNRELQNFALRVNAR